MHCRQVPSDQSMNIYCLCVYLICCNTSLNQPRALIIIPTLHNAVPELSAQQGAMFQLLRCVALRCTVLHCIALHCTALYCIAAHKVHCSNYWVGRPPPLPPPVCNHLFRWRRLDRMRHHWCTGVGIDYLGIYSVKVISTEI